MLKFIARLRKFLVGVEINLDQIKQSSEISRIHIEQMHEKQLRETILKKQPNSLLKYGFSVYSQNDEDGIIQFIFEKLNIEKPNFIEFGVGEHENNTHFLLLKGSRGVWIDGGMSGFIENIKNENLKLVNQFITLENIQSLIASSMQFIKIEKKDIDFISMDLDGNDYYFIENLIQNEVLPKVFCLEYNAKFRDAIVIMPYNAANTWKGDDYFGCSLMAYNQLLNDNYTLIVCNITGANAFYVRNDLKNNFELYPPMELYQPARYYFSSMYNGHAPSNKYLS